MSFPSVQLRLPSWVEARAGSFTVRSLDPAAQMDFVIQLARENSQKGGGPFAAAVFDQEGQLLAPGINLVVAENCSLFHAEIIALMLAQRMLGRYDLSGGGQHFYQLVSSTEPCAMCLGALPWSGVSSLLCSARDEDARAAGFDEGDKPDHWWQQLEQRGIRVQRDLLREQQGRQVLEDYAAAGGVVYNGRSAGLPDYS